MERKAKMVVSKSGSGSTTFRATLPTSWIRDMDLSETERNLIVSYDDIKKEIIIKKLELKNKGDKNEK